MITEWKENYQDNSYCWGLYTNTNNIVQTINKNSDYASGIDRSHCTYNEIVLDVFIW